MCLGRKTLLIISPNKIPIFLGTPEHNTDWHYSGSCTSELGEISRSHHKKSKKKKKKKDKNKDRDRKHRHHHKEKKKRRDESAEELSEDREDHRDSSVGIGSPGK